MKKLSTELFAAAVGLAGLLFTFGAQAQPTPSFAAQTVGVPPTIAAATTTNLATPLFIDAKKARNVGFTLGGTWSTSGESTGNTNILYTLAPTADATHYDTNKTVTLACYNYGAAGNTTYSTTNLDATGLAGWYIIKCVNNSAGGTFTNSQFTQSIKLGAP